MQKIKKILKNIIFFACYCYFSCSYCFAWNAMGHRIIAQIAYEHLTSETKEQVDTLINYLADAYPFSSDIQTASAWADYIKMDNIHFFDEWHYYDKPYSPDNTPVILPPKTGNVLWALQQSIKIFTLPNKTKQFEKALFLRFLLHFAGDAHQPLHCITVFSKNFPEGDKGGNLMLLYNHSRYHQLHAYWDSGLGLLDQKCGFGFSSSKKRKANCLAKKFQQDYPESFFGNKINDVNPENWTNESYEIAKNFAYHQEQADYQSKGQAISEQRITLAGYRLAMLLNNLLHA